jgi:hypothetical protein
MPSQGAIVQTATPTSEFSAQVENAELNAWLDMYAAAPADFAQRFQLEILHREGVVLTRCAPIPFVHFNCVFNLGVGSPATEKQLDAVLAEYKAANITSFAIYHNPACQPAELPQWFEARGLRHRGGWDRIVRDGAALSGPSIEASDSYRVEKVAKDTAPEWAGFIDSTYGLPTAPWLLALVGRPGWHHYLLRKELKVVAVRSMYLHSDGMAWLGIDAPVPGLMAPSYELDLRLCRRIVQDGLALGAKHFVADIEAPSAEMNTPAYAGFGSLGFRKLYFRSHHGC